METMEGDQSPRAYGGRESSPNGATILVVDDQAPAVMVVTRMLERAGCRVVEASEAEDAIEKIRTRQFDALVLDLYLEHLSAIEILQQCPIRPPTVLMTGAQADVSSETLRELRIVEVVRKPLKEWAFVDAVKRALKPERHHNGADRNLNYLDPQHVSEMRSLLEPKPYSEFVSQSLEGCRRVVANLASASASLNSLIWFKHLHTLSGLASTLGARALKEAVENALNVKTADVSMQAKLHETRIAELVEETAKRLAATDDLLTSRERDFLRLVAKGHSTAEIAAIHGVTSTAVDARIKNAAEKLGVNGRIAAVAKAMALGAI